MATRSLDGEKLTLKSYRRLIIPIVLIFAGLILILGSVAYTISINRSLPPELRAGTPDPEVKRVSLADAKAAYDIGAAVFVDVRDQQSYAAEHIPGALSIPLVDLTSRIKELNKDDWIILYCT